MAESRCRRPAVSRPVSTRAAPGPASLGPGPVSTAGCGRGSTGAGGHSTAPPCRCRYAWSPPGERGSESRRAGPRPGSAPCSTPGASFPAPPGEERAPAPEPTRGSPSEGRRARSRRGRGSFLRLPRSPPTLPAPSSTDDAAAASGVGQLDDKEKEDCEFFWSFLAGREKVTMSDFVGARLCPPLPAGCRRACCPRPGSRSAAGRAELLPSAPRTTAAPPPRSGPVARALSPFPFASPTVRSWTRGRGSWPPSAPSADCGWRGGICPTASWKRSTR